MVEGRGLKRESSSQYNSIHSSSTIEDSIVHLWGRSTAARCHADKVGKDVPESWIVARRVESFLPERGRSDFIKSERVLRLRYFAVTMKAEDRRRVAVSPAMLTQWGAELVQKVLSIRTMWVRHNWSGASAASLMSPWQGETS